MMKFAEVRQGVIECTIDLDGLYSGESMSSFNQRWEEFLLSDDANASVFRRDGNIITYPHKSWIPLKKNNKPSVFFLFGNPAPHSVRDDIYFSYERNGLEHRFWRVLREVGFIEIDSNPATIKQDFLDLNYASPFRLGFEVLYTFPSSASKPKWAGVAGIERLFGKNALQQILRFEMARLLPLLRDFLVDGGAIIAMQKDAYNALAPNSYSLKQAYDFSLKSHNESIPLYGTPPTRNMYSNKMKELLFSIKGDIWKENPTPIG
jgi:hypothetical protein